MNKQLDNLYSQLSGYDIEDAVVYMSPIFVFWGATACSQRIFGLAKFYSGKWQISGVAGVMAVGLSSYITQKICYDAIYPKLKKKPRHLRFDGERNIIQTTIVSTMLYSILDLNLCQTIFPSSILTIGSYARGRIFNGWASMSVPTNSPKASPKKKLAVTRLGRVFGCHHCGSRQTFGWKSFIADHMPPTKIANDMNEVFWRRWFGIKVKQALWPQCWNCFQQQGSAVRNGEHILVYSHRFRLHHMAVLLAMYLQRQHFVRGLLDDAEEFILQSWRALRRSIDKIKK